MTQVEHVVLEVHANVHRANDRCGVLNSYVKLKPELTWPELFHGFGCEESERLKLFREHDEAYDKLYKAWEEKHPNPKYTHYDAFDVVAEEVIP
jgi:hypothetical protein